MLEPNNHLSDEELLLLVDGETEGREDRNIRNHLAACWSCRLRLRELEDAIAAVARMHRQTVNSPLPSPEGPRALLKARLRELAVAKPSSPKRWSFNRFTRTASVFAMLGGLLAGVWVTTNSSERYAIPRSDLTPGAVRSQAASEICSVQLNGNAEVLPVVQRQVFAEYGMPNAEARAYEVDYLITPALGGSDDIRNLWPQPYAGSPWNAHVKDALEDYLRGMVCSGRLDLATAQHEIAVNWIAAYKKYFHTRQPLPQHYRP
jgi:anti-sigma factor RsiW